MLCHADNVLLWGKIGAIDNHAAAGDRKREKCLTHCPDPDHRVGKRLPAGGEHKAVALRRTGKEKYPHRQYQKDEEEKRHHDLIGFLDAVGAEEQGKQRTDHHDDVIRNDRVGLRGKRSEPRGSISGHQGAGKRIDQRLENIGNDNRITDGDAKRTCQRQPSQHAACFTGFFSAGSPRAAVRPQCAGSCTASHSEFRRKPDIAEDDDKQQVDEQKCSAAIAAQLVGKSPDICHTDRRADRC